MVQVHYWISLVQLLLLYLLLCTDGNFSLKTYLCLFKRNCLYSPDSALLFDGLSVHNVSMCLKNTEINSDFPKCLAELEHDIAVSCNTLPKKSNLKIFINLFLFFISVKSPLNSIEVAVLHTLQYLFQSELNQCSEYTVTQATAMDFSVTFHHCIWYTQSNFYRSLLS